ncbi:hypothetical protein ES703_68713 [subsurface metagenome]
MALNRLSNDNPLHAVESSLVSKGYPEDAKLLLDALFGGFTNCYIEVRLIKGESVLQFFYPSISAVSWGLIKGKNSEGYNCYFGVCLRKTQKGDKASVASISGLWGDVDAKNFGGGKPEALTQFQKLRPYLFPSIIVDTGHGYHPYWLLKEAELIESPQDILRLEAYMKGLAITLKGDSTSDLSRVLRIPGLINQKDAKNPCLCHIIHWEPERRFNPTDFADYQAEIRKLPKSKPQAKGDRRKHTDEFNALAIEKLLESCNFMQHCRDNAATLTEPYWWAMVHNLAVLGNPGREKIHELSAPHHKYTERETEQKIREALKAADKEIGPHTCKFIEQDLGFSCPEDCLAKKWNFKSPVVLATKLARFGNLPRIIVTNRFLREKTTDTIAAVEQANQPPRIFERGGYLVRVSQDEFGSPYIETLTESACRGFIERAANYVRVNDEGKIIPLAAPPLDIVRDYMSLPHRNLPALLNVTEIPVLRSDGTIVTGPGYDQASRLYYQPAAGLNMPTVPDNPNQKELEAAAALIQEPITDFPFDSEASRTNALAVLITPVCRPMIAGLVPLCLLDKPQPGTGAGLLSDVIAIIATGRPAVMMAPPRTDEECEKRLASILLHGQAIVTIDNIEGFLYFASLAMLLTTTTFQTRILGQTKEVRLPNRSTYVVTGNNVRLGGDLPRRCYLSRMDAREAKPWMRDPKSFKYLHLIQWVREDRGELLAAILTMARSWVAAGKPIPEGLPPLGGFEDWTDTIGGILAHAGFTDFLGNLEFMYQKADVETPQWEGFFTAWQETLGEDAVTTAQVVKAINEYEDFAGALPDKVDRDPKKINRSLGSALSRRNGARYPNGLMVTKSEKPVHHAVAWQVINYQEESEKGGVKGGVSTQNLFSYKSDREGELGELASQARALCLKTPVKKEEEEIYKNGLEHNSPNSLLATDQIGNANSPFSNDLWEGMPDHPREACHTCGGSDFWPDFKGKRFVCSRCHPKPKEIDMEV